MLKLLQRLPVPVQRWPGIRHLRWYLLKRDFDHWWNGFARHHWITPSQKDLEYLDRVWRGEA